jgi:hypothetical protein
MSADGVRFLSRSARGAESSVALCASSEEDFCLFPEGELRVLLGSAIVHQTCQLQE